MTDGSPPALEALRASPNALAAAYERFGVDRRVLLTGHSHQAWPDVGFESHARAWHDAAELVDDKWERAFARAERVRQGYRRLLDDPHGLYALGVNTHELVVRFLSALPWSERPHLVTTDGEFHSIRRQLDRLAEEGLRVTRVPARPAEDLAERLAAAADDGVAAVLVSAVLFADARIVRGLSEVATACRRVGAELLVDAYHALNAIEFTLPAEGLEGAFVVGGGYKYCQLGEGACFLRFPEGREYRPVITGWFSEFTALDGAERPDRVVYGQGADQFAGSTYDPTSHYRAAAVFDFFAERRLAPGFLRAVSRHQVGYLAERFDALDLDPRRIRRDRDVDLAEVAGFLALRAPDAERIVAELRRRDVFADSRGDVLRLGPAPYLSDRQLAAGIDALGEIIASA